MFVLRWVCRVRGDLLSLIIGHILQLGTKHVRSVMHVPEDIVHFLADCPVLGKTGQDWQHTHNDTQRNKLASTRLITMITMRGIGDAATTNTRMLVAKVLLLYGGQILVSSNHPPSVHQSIVEFSAITVETLDVVPQNIMVIL